MSLFQMKLQRIWRVSKSETEKTDREVASSFKALELSNPPALDSKPCISTSTKTVELDEHARDSGYGSATSTPNPKDTAIPLRKPGQIPLIQQMGLCISNKAMEPKAKRRFLEVQLEIEKMLLEFMRKLKSGPGMYKPIAIRPMMLGKTDSDADAKSYMVVICSENIKRKVQDFFDEPLVKSLCEPGGDDEPSFKVLVIGHALRLRASASDISVQSVPMHSFYDAKRTFCGMPIRLCDERGYSRKATFGGMVKVISTDGEHQLYGLTAGHIIRDGQITTEVDDTIMDTWDGSSLVDLDLSQANHTRTGSPAVSDDNDQNGLDDWCLRNQQHLGKVLNTGRRETLVDEDQSQRKPFLDWALFGLNVHRPNQLAYHGREHSQGDLHLPFSIIDPRKSGIPVTMLCASQGAKRGMLSTTRARVLLDPGASFTDVYTLSLEGSEISDGDSRSWVVDELRLEVYGHVVADDVFGDVYAIPMIS
ncbi:hypothetical protein INS49_002995 [Diaporthe citri]|uniref:uncharacterized protein n=1 Tax=Diaporthe citri TaxID=83186 RepID=UPI001C802845|nr:uncharacterized protein INS49_002995 [Diaporthe citri]KAG6368781.1 hypothetical protein INS49_002995 [Diaporthe citri]